MSEKTSEEGNTGAPRVGENEVPSGDTRRNQGTRGARGMSYKQAHGYGKTSWISVILGWICALGSGLILGGIVGAIVGGIVAALGLGASGGSISGMVGTVITLLLAFFIGGYTAGWKVRLINAK